MDCRSLRSAPLVAVVILLSLTGRPSSQAPASIDFARDVQPILRQSCVGCHGPSQQMGGFRLDRRRDAMRGGTIAVIGPGNSAGSRLYQRLIGSDFGPQMPPTGALPADKVAVIKTWIDEGAEWPDEVAGDVSPTTPDPDAERLIAALKRNDRDGVAAVLKSNVAAANRKGRNGVTPLMAAALDSDPLLVQLLLDSGADPNAANDAEATALMWAVPDARKTELLLARGANPNARSADGRTPIIIAAGFRGSAPAIRLLLAHRADLSATGYDGARALSQAAYAADPEAFSALAAGGADLSKAGPLALYFAIDFGCRRCAEQLLKPGVLNNQQLSATVVGFLGPPSSDATRITPLLEAGADPQAKDSAGHTLLMLAAASDRMPLDLVQALIDRGVDVNATTAKGETALGLARQRGAQAVVDLLLKAGAKDTAQSSAPPPAPAPATSIRSALGRSLPLLQQNDVTSLKKAGCVSCHNNTFTATAVAEARRSRLPVDEQKASAQVKAIAAYLESWRERALQGIGIPGDSDTIGYILLGLAAEKFAPNETTDAMARYLKGRQLPDGRWKVLAHRPPLESSDIEVTAVAMRALQVYAPARHGADYRAAVDRAAVWLKAAKAETTEDRAFLLYGLRWSNAARELVAAQARALIAEQRSDGGWSQIPTLSSDGYATGQAVASLLESGAARKDNPVIQRAIQYLLNTQLADGSWFVRTRAIRIQPHYESGFPHGTNQFISAAATNWASTALALAAR